jgi:hypothetical protein
LSAAIGPGHKLAFLIVCAALLAVCALLGVAWAAGFGQVWQQLIYPHWRWLPVALAAEAVAYLGYTLAYREVARAEGGLELDTPKAAALVATGFGVFLQGGGFALDREALTRTGFSEAEARARVLSQRTREALAMKKAAGVRLGRPPTVPKAIVRRIQRQRARGDTLRAIADSLNQDTVPTAQGGAQWYAATVRGVLARSL